MFGMGELEGEEGLYSDVMGVLREGKVAIEGRRANSTAEVGMGAEMVRGEPNTLFEHTGAGDVSHLLKNRFSSIAMFGSPGTLDAGLMQPVICFIPLHSSFV